MEHSLWHDGVTPSGAFTISSAYTWELSNLYTTGEITLMAAPSLPGDYNHNGGVDAADYTVWRDGLGQTGAGLAAGGVDAAAGWSREHPDSTLPNALIPSCTTIIQLSRTAMNITHRQSLQFAATAVLSLLIVRTGYGATLVRTASSNAIITHPGLPTGYTTVPFATTSIETHVFYSGVTNTFASSTVAGAHFHAYNFFIGPYQLTSNVNQSGPANQPHAHLFDGAVNRVFGPDSPYFGNTNAGLSFPTQSTTSTFGHSHGMSPQAMNFTTTARFNLADIQFPLIDVPDGSTLVLEGGQLRGSGLVLDGALNHTNGTLSISTGEYVHNGGTLTIEGGTAAATPTFALTNSARAREIHTMTIGDTNQGFVTVEQGSELENSAWAIIADDHGSTGEVVVRDPGSLWFNSSVLYVSNNGTAVVSVLNGASLSSTDGYIGNSYDTTGSGAVTINGVDSNWTTRGSSLHVGRLGSGALTISAGGQVIAGDGHVASSASVATGIATVTGSGSKWANSGGLYVGGTATARGGTASLTVADGGEVTAAGALKIWHDGVLTLDGGSVTAGSFDRYFGTFHHHDGTLTVAGGPYVHYSASGLLDVDGNDPTAHARLVLDGVTSATGVTATRVGDTGRGSLAVVNGSVFPITGTAWIGYSPGSNGDVRVSDAQWNVEQLILGRDGNAVGSLLIEAGGTVNSTSGEIGDAAGSNGDVRIEGTGSQWTSSGEIRVGNLGTGTLSIFAGGQVTAPIVTVGGTLNNSGLIQANVQLNGGTLRGSGQVDGVVTVHASGVISPGTSPGTLTVGGLALMPDGILEIELGDIASDRLVVNGEASLGGILNVSLLEGLTPTASQSFNILDWESTSGTFSSINLPEISGGLQWNTSQLYTTGVLSVSLAGDYNGNGLVDAADYTVWRDGLGGTYTQSHYDQWKQNFGAASPGIGAGNGADAGASVPEPAPWMLLLVGLSSFAVCRGFWFTL
ncbi:MAG: hypothetical protein WD851_03490 [Pirellulales bacterium]